MGPIKVKVDLLNLNDQLKSEIFETLLFEPKDQYALQLFENFMQDIIPGNYKLVNWASMSTDLDVIIEFSSQEEFVLFQLKW